MDLRDTAPAVEQARSVQLFTNEARYLEMLCNLIDLDYELIQQAVQRQYPQWFSTPRGSYDTPAAVPPAGGVRDAAPRPPRPLHRP